MDTIDQINHFHQAENCFSNKIIYECEFGQTLCAQLWLYSAWTKLYKRQIKDDRPQNVTVSLSWLDNCSKLQQHACSVPVVGDFYVSSVILMS